MPLAKEILVDNSTKTIVKANGLKNEDNQSLVEISGLKNSSSDSSLNISGLHYAIEGTGSIQVFYTKDNSKKITLTGNGAYPRPDDVPIGYVSGDINITSDTNVNKYNIIIECQKREGFN
jgi:hypothetical protein